MVAGCRMSERIQNIIRSRAWLSGYFRDLDGVLITRRVEEFTEQDRDCRRALAQLLIDGDAPQEILDLLAVAIAPDAKDTRTSRKVGEHLFRTDSTQTELGLAGSDRTLHIKRRDNVRSIDPALIGTILRLMRERIHLGRSIEKSSGEVSELLEVQGITLSARTIKGYWDELSKIYSQD